MDTNKTDSKRGGLNHPTLENSNVRPEASIVGAGVSDSLAPRSLALQVLSLSAAALIVVYLIFALHQLLGAQSLFEAAQQQRVFNQRYTKEVLLAASGVPVNYEKTAHDWAQTMALLSEGGKIQMGTSAGKSATVHPPLQVSKFKGALDTMTELRRRIIQESSNYLQSARLNSHREELFDELYRQSLELQAAGDALVETFDKHLDSGVSWWDVNAVAVELAERQRMLIQQHIKEVLFVAHGIPADYQATRLRLYESAKILSEGGSIMIDNKNVITVPAPANEDIRFNLEHQKEVLDRFTGVSNQYLMLANEDVERSIQLKKISDLTSEFHVSATTLLTEYRSFFEGRIAKAEREAVLACILVGLFAVLLGWAFMRKYVDIPVGRMMAALKALREGKQAAFDIKDQPGPVGAMGVELEKCVLQWQSRQVWFDQFLAADDAASVEDPGANDPVASRVYQWYRSRTASESIQPRWQQADKTDEEITVVGRLLDSDSPSLPMVNDSELLDQLIQRANELQSQHENLSQAHDLLLKEAETLRSSAARLKESETGLVSQNKSLQEENAVLGAQLSSQISELARLQTQLETLHRSESAIATGSEEIKKVNSELLASLDRQSVELRTMKVELQSKSRDLDAALRNLDALKSKTEQESVQMRQAMQEDRATLSGLTEKLEHAEKSAAQIKASLEHALQENILLESSRRDAMREAGELRGQVQRDEHRIADLTQKWMGSEQKAADLAEAQRALTGRIQDLELGLAASEETRKDEADRAGRLIQEMRREYESALHLSEKARAQLETVSADQLRQIGLQEEVIGRLERSLGDQTQLLEAIRAEFSDAMRRYAADISHRDDVIRRSDAALQETGAQLDQARASLETREAELWQIRKELAESHRLLATARIEISRLSDVQIEQSAVITSMREDLAQLNRALESKTQTLDEIISIRRSLEQKIAQAESAYRDKCQALASAEERLSATRTALKTTLEELQERSKN